MHRINYKRNCRLTVTLYRIERQFCSIPKIRLRSIFRYYFVCVRIQSEDQNIYTADCSRVSRSATLVIWLRMWQTQQYDAKPDHGMAHTIRITQHKTGKLNDESKLKKNFEHRKVQNHCVEIVSLAFNSHRIQSHSRVVKSIF